MQDGAAKRATGALLRRVILKKAGLDACKQLIVGSAPVSEALLLYNENPRIVRGFQKAYSYESIRPTLC